MIGVCRKALFVGKITVVGIDEHEIPRINAR